MMNSLSIQLNINSKLFLKNPQESDLGRRIIQEGILLFDEIGYEKFTFKKLAQRCEAAESSIYRYFENKHYLLLYLINWYWEWTSFLIDVYTQNIHDPTEKMRKTIQAILQSAEPNERFGFIDEKVLHKIVALEGIKAYYVKDVDEENSEGSFLVFKKISEQIGQIIKELKPTFPYPHSMASNLLNLAHNQVFFAEHLPRLTDLKCDSKPIQQQVDELLKFFVFEMIQKSNC